MIRSAIVACAFVICCACSSGGGNTATVDGGSPVDGNTPDQLVVSDAAPEAAPDANLGPPTALPIPASDIVSVQSAGGMDIDTAVVGSALVFDHYADENLSSGTLMIAAIESESFASPQPLELGTETLYGGPSAIGSHLYYVAGTSLTGAATLHRRALDAGSLGAPQVVQMPDTLMFISWPQVRQLNDGSFAVAYRDGQSVVKLAFSADGLAFGAPTQLGPPGAMAKVAQMSNGTLIFTYQIPSAPMLSYYRLSSDQTQWTEPALVTTQSPNVHDTNPYVRADGRIDLYYIYPVDAIGFSLWRRCVKDDGALGPEEQVVETSWGNLAKPHAHRLPSGETLLTFVEQNSGHMLSATTLVGDAECP